MFKYEYRKNPYKKLEGEQYMFEFDNGYGASVIRSTYSYGGNNGLFELAVINWIDKDNWDFNYNTEITSEVIGYLTEEEVNDILDKIKLLIRRKKMNNKIEVTPSKKDEDEGYFDCPNCERLIYCSDDLESHKYCLNCGVKLKWEEE